jgi:integrase
LAGVGFDGDDHDYRTRRFPRLRDPRNKGRLIGQKRPLKPKDVWTIRVRLQMERRRRDLAMFNLAIDSKLRGCDLMRLRIDDVFVGERVRDRATVIQKKTGRPVQFEITEQTRRAIGEWIADLGTSKGPHLFPSRFEERPHLSTRLAASETSETRPLKWSQSHRNRHSYLIEIPTLSDEPRYGQSLLPLCP